LNDAELRAIEIGDSNANDVVFAAIRFIAPYAILTALD